MKQKRTYEAPTLMKVQLEVQAQLLGGCWAGSSGPGQDEGICGPGKTCQL